MKNIIFIFFCFSLVAASNKCNTLYCNNMENTIKNVEIYSKCSDIEELKNAYYINCYGCFKECNNCNTGLNGNNRYHGTSNPLPN